MDRGQSTEFMSILSKYPLGLSIIAGAILASFSQTAYAPILGPTLEINSVEKLPTYEGAAPDTLRTATAPAPVLKPKVEETNLAIPDAGKKVSITSPKPSLKVWESSPLVKNETSLQSSSAAINAAPLTARPNQSIIPPTNISGTQEVRFDDARRIKPWGAIYYKLLAETNELKHCVQNDVQCTTPNLKSWSDQIRPLKPLPRQEQIGMVNSMINQLGYRSDVSNFGQTDYWSTPTEFIQLRGDCEDIAIFKFASLMALGIPNHDMRIVVGKLQNGRSHAFLSIRTGTSEQLLDNRTNFVTSAAGRMDFQPLHSMNFVNRWVHLPKKNRSYSG